MNSFFEYISKIDNIDGAITALKEYSSYDEDIENAVNFSIKAHKNQFRKSGEPYAVHPILVATIASYFSNDKDITISALLHDVVEDTDYSIEYIEKKFGKDISTIVDGLTKITEIRDSEFPSNSSDAATIKSALTFRKMVVASIGDVRILILKLCDRTHNMLTLNALPKNKQIRISKETLLVYAPIAHRLGISTIKNILEDLSFFYIYPNEYKKIDSYINQFKEKIEQNYDSFIKDLKEKLSKYKDVDIFSRIKHYYSIFLKMQRKGINIDEVLDLLAVRIITNNTIECYEILGILHTSYKPLISRFKDYVAIPKENGYQTIHTTIFYNGHIFEIQIRTKDMHKVAEYGIAAHYKYKGGFLEAKEPNLKWLKTLEVDKNKDIIEFYDDTKQELFSEDIIVYSPKGDIFTLPRNAIAYDFAYAIHTDIGNKAIIANINNTKKSLLTELKSGDIISIEVGNKDMLRCSWLNLVKTTKAKKAIKYYCQQRLNKINYLVAKNMINTIFSKYNNNILNEFKQLKLNKVSTNLDMLKQVKHYIQKKVIQEKGFFTRIKLTNIKLKEYRFDDILLYSNFTINSISHDHCCHPKIGDEIVGFYDNKDVQIHHKLCEQAYEMIKQDKKMVFCKWNDDKYYGYKAVVSFSSKKGELARLLNQLLEHNGIILFLEYGKDRHSYVQYCNIEFEIKNSNINEVKKILSQKSKIIEIYKSTDAFN